MRTFLYLLPTLLLWFAWGPAHALDALRSQEIAQCLPGEVQTWGDGRDRPALSPQMVFVYDHTGAPAWFDQATVLGAVRRAVSAWSECGVTGTVVSAAPGGSTPGAVSVVWSEAGSVGNFGLADLGRKTLSLGPAAFQLLQTRNPAYDARETLQMVISHEVGHMYGVVAHSRRCVDVTSYYNNGKGELCSIRGGGAMVRGVEYRSVLPTACDLQRCRAANGTTGRP
ncbi:hypothetical protein [Rhodoferax saidenbachensis]|nr:hypothetical protein [Rhodoferax saidenbachensis]